MINALAVEDVVPVDLAIERRVETDQTRRSHGYIPTSGAYRKHRTDT